MTQKNQALIQARQNTGYSQAKLAEAVKIEKVSYQRYELGLREPKAKIANRIAKVLNSTSEELFGT